MDEEKINKKADKIIESAEEIKEEIKPKKAKTRGDPLVELH